jgi:hypothetical protein
MLRWFVWSAVEFWWSTVLIKAQIPNIQSMAKGAIGFRQYFHIGCLVIQS